MSLAVTARQVAFQLVTGGGIYRLFVEGLVVGSIMAGIQVYALQQAGIRIRHWFWSTMPGWLVGWVYGWAWGWLLLGSYGLNVVFFGRGWFIGALAGLLQAWLPRERVRYPWSWPLVSSISWGLGFGFTTMVGGAFAWMVAGAIAGLLSGLMLRWYLN